MATSSLDTSVVIRILVNDSPNERMRAARLLAEPNHLFRLEDLVLSEVVYVLTTVYGLSRNETIDRLSFFLAHYSNNLIYNHALTDAVFPFFLAHPKLSFNDCCLAVYSELNHAEPLFTLDKKLASQSPSAKLL